MTDSSDRLILRLKSKGYLRESPIPGPIVACLEDGRICAAVEAKYVGDNVKLEFTRYNAKYPRAAEAALATAATYSLIFDAGCLIFVGSGQASADEQEVGRRLKFVYQNISLQLRLSIANYQDLPSEFLTIDIMAPIFAAQRVLDLAASGEMAIPRLTCEPILTMIWELARSGVPAIDWPSKPRRH